MLGPIGPERGQRRVDRRRRRWIVEDRRELAWQVGQHVSGVVAGVDRLVRRAGPAGPLQDRVDAIDDRAEAPMSTESEAMSLISGSRWPGVVSWRRAFAFRSGYASCLLARPEPVVRRQFPGRPDCSSSARTPFRSAHSLSCRPRFGSGSVDAGMIRSSRGGGGR